MRLEPKRESNKKKKQGMYSVAEGEGENKDLGAPGGRTPNRKSKRRCD